MSGYQLLQFYTTSRVSRLGLLARPFVPPFVRRYSKENYQHHAEEKAPTTAEEFIRVAEEMAEERKQQGVSSAQTEDKAQNDMKEAATTSDKKGNDSDDLLKSNPQSQISS
ncbi:hypothetical protein HAX54_016543 [Datura stramonium]|uniref:Uncharacterized protein n=1 Tax=Datura stramonium TaxID=4076 RepID=A0ABS8S085_DATST|nr:hypothetical protein [Datura stramonium]